MMKIIPNLFITIILFLSTAYCDCFEPIDSLSPIMLTAYQFAQARDTHDLFRSYDISESQSGVFLTKNGEVYNCSHYLDAFEGISCLNELLRNEELVINVSQDLDLYVSELLSLQWGYKRLDPCSFSNILSLDTTINIRLASEFENLGISQEIVCAYYDRVESLSQGYSKLYVINKTSRGIEYLTSPEIQLAFILVTVLDSSFQIEIVSLEEAKEIMMIYR